MGWWRALAHGLLLANLGNPHSCVRFGHDKTVRLGNFGQIAKRLDYVICNVIDGQCLICYGGLYVVALQKIWQWKHTIRLTSKRLR
jgi:hypothetical protein